MNPGSVTQQREGAGFTLLEALVASGTAAVVILGALAFLVAHLRDYSNQNMIRDTQRDVEFAMDSMVRDLRMAGYGLNVSTADLPLWLKCAGGQTNNPLVLAGAGIGGSDAVQVVGAFRHTAAALVQPAVRGSSELKLATGQARQLGVVNGCVVCIGGVEAARVISCANDALTVSTHPTRQRALTRNYEQGARVERVEALTYVLKADSLAIADSRPFLARIRPSDTNQSVADQVVAIGIEELTLTNSGYGVTVELAGRTAAPLRTRSGPGANTEYRSVRARTFVLPRNSPPALQNP